MWSWCHIVSAKKNFHEKNEFEKMNDSTILIINKIKFWPYLGCHIFWNFQRNRTFNWMDGSDFWRLIPSNHIASHAGKSWKFNFFEKISIFKNSKHRFSASSRLSRNMITWNKPPKKPSLYYRPIFEKILRIYPPFFFYSHRKKII